MKKLRKLLLCVMILLAAVIGTPQGMTGMMSCVEVQAAELEKPILMEVSAGSRSGFVRWSKVKGASGYRIYRKVDGKHWRLLQTTTDSSSLIYKDNNMKPGICYVYTVRAYKKVNGKTILSGYDKKGIRIATKPSKPSLTVKKSAEKECTVEVNINPTEGAQGYRIYRKTYGGSWKVIGYTTKNTYEDTNLEPGYIYYYTARAYCKYYGETYYSACDQYGVHCKVMETNSSFAKVRDYIMEKGRTDANGKFIREVLTVDGGKLQWRIYYDPKQEWLELIQLSEGDGYHDKLRMYLYETPLEVRPYYNFYMEDGSLRGYTTFKPESYTGKKDMRFRLKAMLSGMEVQIEDYEAENAAVNDIMRLAFAGWNELLNSKVNVSLKKLGFKSYVPIA